MAAEELLNLFDSLWFELSIFRNTYDPEAKPQEKPNPDLEINQEPMDPSTLVPMPSSSTLQLRSLSDQDMSFITNLDSDSPNSVLKTRTTAPKLQTILSGKQMTEFSEQDKEEVRRRHETLRKNKKKKRNSKSLSDLEYEELKGFMDLGFVFSEEDHMDSNLVSMIPGLQRHGKKDEEEKGNEFVEARPYLSGAWEVLERRKPEIVMRNWRINDLGNTVEMKDHLRSWAHNVASTVK